MSENFMKNIAFTAIAVCIATLSLSACTNPTGTAGAMNSSYGGTVKGIELIDIDSKKYDTSTNTVIGGIAGAVLGAVINDHTSGALVGAGLGAAAGGLGSKAANHTDGLRISLESDNGDVMVDVPFNCGFELGQKVRIINGSQGAQIQFFKNGAYHTAMAQSSSQCPTQYKRYQRGLYQED